MSVWVCVPCAFVRAGALRLLQEARGQRAAGADPGVPLL